MVVEKDGVAGLVAEEETRAPEIFAGEMFGPSAARQEGAVSDTETNLLKQRSMLVILIAACSTARTAFEAADNAVDGDLLQDCRR